MDRTITYAQAITEATIQAMEMDSSVIVIGQGTRDKGQIFGSVEGLFDKYGPQRIIEMPIAENTVSGICVGAALNGLRPLLILQRADFAFLALDQLINHASKYHFMFGGQVKIPITVRLIVGKGWGQGPQHSQDLHSMFAHFPGLRVIAPSDPYTVKGALLNSIFCDDPVIIFEGRPLYLQSQEVPLEPYVFPLGKARKITEGKDVTIAAVSFLVPEALAAAAALSKDGFSAEVLDIASISPLDIEAIKNSVEKTGRLLIADTSWSFCGISAEISSQINELLFNRLKAPVARLTIPFCPAPAASELENKFYPNKEQIEQFCRKMIFKKEKK